MKNKIILIPPSQITSGSSGDGCEETASAGCHWMASPMHKAERDNPAALRSRRGLSRYSGLARGISILSVIVLIVFLDNNLLRGEANIYDYTGESIQYLIEPVGKSEYKNFGTVDLKGVRANLVTLKSKILFVEVMEKVFYDPQGSLPYKTERANSGPWFKEYRTEEYNQKKFTVIIKKFKGKKLVKEKKIKTDGPIQNMNTLLFYLRNQPDLKIGRHFTAKVLVELKLVEFDLKLLSIDEIIVPAGKFQAYHFKSVPDTFEIWIDKSSPRIPLKIKIKGIVNCSLLMKGYSLHNNQENRLQ